MGNTSARLLFALAVLLGSEQAGALASAHAKPGSGSQANKGPATVQSPEAVRVAAEAQAALREGNYAAAISGFQQLLKMAPAVPEVHANLGMAYYFAGRHSDAARECREALKQKPSLVNARYFMGVSLAESGQCQEAVPYLEKDYPRVADPQLKRVIGADATRCAMSLDQPDRAVDFVRALNRDYPDDPDLLYLSSHVYSDLSSRASGRLLATAPGSYQAHQLNAEVLALQGKLSEAGEEYRKVLSLNPRLAGIHYELGRLLLASPRGPTTLEDAEREFEEELKLDPDNAAAEYELGEMAREGRHWNDAIRHFSRATTVEPHFVEALIGLGKSLISAGRPQDAVAPLEAAVKLQPGNPNTHYQLSFAYRRLGRDQEAENELVAYRQAHEKVANAMQAIRTGILGNMSEPQSEAPPE